MTDRRRPQPAARETRRAFTLTELLIVIGLIVLVVTLAIPAFNVITGGRSIDAAENQLSALFGQARAEAVGLQEERGVLFYTDPGTGRIAAGIVRNVSAYSNAALALDFAADREHVVLPIGVSLQTVINSASMSGGTRSSDGYLGQNFSAATSDRKASYGGVILFDGRGRVTSRLYGFLISDAASKYTQLGALLYGDVLGGTAGSNGMVLNPTIIQPSQVAFCMFGTEGFNSRGFSTADAASYTAGGTASEQAEEKWIDGDAGANPANPEPVGDTVFFLLNRYNGTLIRNN